MTGIGIGAGLGVLAGRPLSYSPLTLSTDLNSVPAWNELVNFGNFASSEILVGDSKSVGVWIKIVFNVSAFIQHIICNYDYGGGGPAIDKGWILGATAADRLFFLISSGPGDWIRTEFNAATGLDGTWHHIVGTYGGTGSEADMTLYCDGVAAAQTKTSAGVVGDTTSGAQLSNEASWGGNLTMQGKLCHTTLVDRELTQSQVAKMSSLGVPIDMEALLDPSEILHWCTYGDGCAFVGANQYPDLSPLAQHGIPLNLEVGDIQGDVPP